MNRCAISILILAWVAAVSPAGAEPPRVFLDFDDDGDPATIRTEAPVGQDTATVRVVLAVGETDPNGQTIRGRISHGCCIAGDMTYYGLWGGFDYDPSYMDPQMACRWVMQQGDPSSWGVLAGGYEASRKLVRLP